MGLPFTHLYPSRSLVRGILNVVVPVHSSARLTPFASVRGSLIICSKALSYSCESDSSRRHMSMGLGMFHSLGRKASIEVLHDADR